MSSGNCACHTQRGYCASGRFFDGVGGRFLWSQLWRGSSETGWSTWERLSCTWSCHVSESFCAMVRSDLFVAHIVGPNKLQVYLTFVGFLKYSIEIKDPYSLRCLDSIDSWKPSPAPSSNIFRSTKSGLYQSLLSIARTGWIPVQWNCNLIATTFIILY
jgi:hypothetical protein